jgi:dephospho-CoA kinase
LIYEAGLDRILDAVVVVDAEEKKRIERVCERDGITADEVGERISAQLDSASKRRRADYVVRNDGSRDELERSAILLHSIFDSIAQEGRRK